jgi:hypothetical protein
MARGPRCAGYTTRYRGLLPLLGEMEAIITPPSVSFLLTKLLIADGKSITKRQKLLEKNLG